jgi:hypothetical protein
MRKTLSSFALGFVLGMIGAGLAAAYRSVPAAAPVSDWRTKTYVLRNDPVQYPPVQYPSVWSPTVTYIPPNSLTVHN